MTLITVVCVLVVTAPCLISGGSSSISIYQSTSNVPPLAESYSEGACVIPQTARKVDPKWVVRQSTFYVPIASQYTFRLYAETFLSRAGVSDQDIKSMCLTMDFFPDGPGVNLTNTGFDLREFKQTCPVIWRGQFTCLPVGGSPGTNAARARSTDNYVVSVDNQSYMLIVRCVDGFFKDYMLLTTRPVVSPELYHTVVNTIKDLGFDERKLQMLTYDTCLRTDRFVTAVNVHHHHNHHHHHHSSSSGSGSSSRGVIDRDRDSDGDNDTPVPAIPPHRQITIKTGGPGGISVHHGGSRIPPSQLRPSFGSHGGHSRRIHIAGPPRVDIVSSGGGGGIVPGGGHGGGRGSTKVEELEAIYAILPQISGG